MVKCKICGEKADFLYWLARNGMCVYCYNRLDRLLNPIVESEEESKEWDRRHKISTKAVKEFFKRGQK